MNLTYQVTEKGYKILNNGIPWIVQDACIPFPASTLEESAQLHIQSIIEENSKPTIPSPEEEILKLKEHVADLYELILFGGAE